MNQLTLIGTIFKSPTYHCTERARDLLRFTLQVKRQQKMRAVTRSPLRAAEVPADVHYCLAWGPAALDLHANLKAGDRLLVSGELRYSNHRNRRGELSRFAEVYITGYTYLGQEKPSRSENNRYVSRATRLGVARE
ncbi:single-stranded DNA-binding protein [Neolewinella antarctica]|uniref:Single-stranded DNA-binding protein n=1 Tax=Neolewinella antarctica TaxID=442734 RepID=A0ABX0X8R3_9BACT|nr:single-stranded DNA-binding protein [Neolewinella antarctica]NJC25202.1 single-stranded DNA-binding protein [Neolewinella antarctica]